MKWEADKSENGGIEPVKYFAIENKDYLDPAASKSRDISQIEHRRRETSEEDENSARMKSKFETVKVIPAAAEDENHCFFREIFCKTTNKTKYKPEFSLDLSSLKLSQIVKHRRMLVLAASGILSGEKDDFSIEHPN